MSAAKLLGYNLPLFADLTTSDFSGISVDFAEQTLNAGQTLFDQGDTSFDVYFSLSGTLLAVYWTTHGREIVYARFPTGAYFGELAAMDGTSRSLAVIAKSPASVLCLNRSSFLKMYDEVPSIRNKVNTGLIAQIRTLTHKNMEMTTLSVAQRTIRYIYRLANDHGAMTVGGVILDAPTHAEIAGSIGANREMVSRTMSRLSRQGVIKSSRQKIIIVDPDALKSAAT